MQHKWLPGLGGIKYIDLDGNGVINSDDRTFIGSTLPKNRIWNQYYLAYKDFDFLFWIRCTGRIGQDPYILE
jgi:hypothetical protein